MTSLTWSRDQLRPLRLLQRLQLAAPAPLGETALFLYLQQDPDLSPTIERVRQSLRLLSQHSLVAVIGHADTDWLAASITQAGIAFLEGEGADDIDIPRPAECLHKNGGPLKTTPRDLPPDTKAWLDQELVARGFRGYAELQALLASKGYQVSPSTLKYYGKSLKKEQAELKQTIEMAKAFQEAVGDDSAALNESLTALAQQELLNIIRSGAYDKDDIDLVELVRSIASLNRSDVNTKKYQAVQKARKQALVDAAAAIEKVGAAQGMSKEGIDAFATEVLGLPS